MGICSQFAFHHFWGNLTHSHKIRPLRKSSVHLSV